MTPHVPYFILEGSDDGKPQRIRHTTVYKIAKHKDKNKPKISEQLDQVNVVLSIMTYDRVCPMDTQLGSQYCSAYAAPCMHDTSSMVHMLCIHHGVYVVYPHKR